MFFKNNKVWVATHPDGTPQIREGKALIKYQLDQSYEYRVYAKQLRPLEEAAIHHPPKPSSPRRGDLAVTPKGDKQHTPADDEKTIHIYTDGASSGNPGPAGIGVVLNFGKHKREISAYIGVATNNIAELEAIRAGMSELKRKDVPVRIYTDSNYAYGLLMLGWKPKKNQDLVVSIKKKMAAFKDLKIVKIKGHAGLEGNERADRLAVQAIKTRK